MTILHHYNLQEIKNEEIVLKVNITLPRHKNYLKAFSTLTNKIETGQCVVIVSHSGSVRHALK